MTTCCNSCIIATMTKHAHVTVKIWEDTRRMLRILSAFMGKSMVEVLHWLVKREYDKRGVDKP